MRLLICPPIVPPTGVAVRALRAARERLLELRKQTPDFDTLVGLELRVALIGLRNGNDDSKLRALLYRPAIEPILLTLGPRVHHANFNQLDTLGAACALAGRTLAYRKARCFGKSENGDVEFEPPDRVALWFPALKTVIHNPKYDLAAPAVALALTIIAHPMSDGNGRLARFLTHALLLKGMSCPLAPVALTPSLYEHRLALASSLSKLCESGDWQHYYQLFAKILSTGIELARSTLFPQH